MRGVGAGAALPGGMIRGDRQGSGGSNRVPDWAHTGWDKLEREMASWGYVEGDRGNGRCALVSFSGGVREDTNVGCR